MKLKPFSQHIIFYDTEFTSLDPYKGELLSIGLVKLNGEELYLELDYQGESEPWVVGNVLPSLTAPKVSREVAKKLIRDFVGEAAPYMVAYVDIFDAVYTYKLFGATTDPFHWIPLDFASMLFAHSIDPEEYKTNRRAFLAGLGIDEREYRHHNALDDAKLLRETYLRLSDTT